MNEIWRPFPKQERVLTITPEEAFEILFGGSRGPGKTDAGIVWLLGNEIDDEGHLYIHHPRYRALVLRRDYGDLSDWIDRANHMYKRYGAVVIGNPAVVRWPSGAKFRLGHLKNKKSYEKYLGHEYQRQLIEELTQIAEEKHYVNILGSCRSTVSGLKPQVFNTTNPPGVGHLWVKKRFVDPSPSNTAFKGEDGRGRIYVPATIDDNPVLIKKDPGYLAYLEGLKLTDPELYEAWRHGSWDVMAGQYFKNFKVRTHVVPPFEPLDELVKSGGMDWGRRAPFCFLAIALEKVNYIDDKGMDFKFNRVWVYKELYAAEKSPKEWAGEIKKVVNLDQFSFIMADPKMFHRLDDGSRSISTHFQEEDVTLMEANNDRLAGWEAVKNWMSIAPDGLPYMMISELCSNLVRTIPGQIHDETNAEDLDCYVKGTKILTPSGEENVEDIKVGDDVITPIGNKKVVKAGISGTSDDVCSVFLSDGRILRGTIDHEVATFRGLVELQHLLKSDILMEKTISIKYLWGLRQFFTRVLFTVKVVGENIIDQMGLISRKVTKNCIVRFMSTILDQFQKGTISIIKTITVMIIPQKILLPYQDNNIVYTTTISRNQKQKIIGINGKKVKMVGCSYKRMQKQCGKIHQCENSSVEIVKLLLKLDTLLNFIVKSVNTLKGFINQLARFVGKNFYKRKTEKEQPKPARIIAVGDFGREKVYRLTIADAHLYYANGILSTNTDGEDHAVDALRYDLIHLDWVDANVGTVPRTSPEPTAQRPDPHMRRR